MDGSAVDLQEPPFILPQLSQYDRKSESSLRWCWGMKPRAPLFPIPPSAVSPADVGVRTQEQVRAGW